MVVRNNQTGANAPRRGTLLKASPSGVVSHTVPAITRFPPPDFMTRTQKNVWIAALSDMPLEFFRARHIPTMIQYCRAVERMMHFSDQWEKDIEDDIARTTWIRMMQVVRSLENQLSMGTNTLILLGVKARSEHRVANQSRNAAEAGEDDRNTRAGLTYVSN